MDIKPYETNKVYVIETDVGFFVRREKEYLVEYVARILGNEYPITKDLFTAILQASETGMCNFCIEEKYIDENNLTQTNWKLA